MNRRLFTQALAATLAAFSGAGQAAVTPAAARARLAAIEAASGGRLGVAVLDTRDGQRYGQRGGERFALCSTFKLLAAAFVLARVDRGQDQLERAVPYGRTDLVDYSPATEPQLARGALRVDELCDAAVTLSDNTAANLLLRDFGGPAALTAWLRSIGDQATRLDRNEPTLNTAIPGDPRDTTTPDAMLSTLQKLLLGDALSAASRARLNGWLRDNKTGDKRLRAGLAPGWSAGEKTGSGGYGTHNDIGVLWTPARTPILVCAYLTETRAAGEVRDRSLADVARLVAGG